MKNIPLCLLLFLATTCLAAKPNEVLQYGDAGVTISGTIFRQVFPGRPNFEDISQGDEADAYWILHLAHPVDMAAYQPLDACAPALKDVRVMQLVFHVLNDKSYKDFPNILGKPVTVTGQLFGATTGHHHTDVLLEVRDITFESDVSAETPKAKPDTPALAQTETVVPKVFFLPAEKNARVAYGATDITLYGPQLNRFEICRLACTRPESQEPIALMQSCMIYYGTGRVPVILKVATDVLSPLVRKEGNDTIEVFYSTGAHTHVYQKWKLSADGSEPKLVEEKGIEWDEDPRLRPELPSQTGTAAPKIFFPPAEKYALQSKVEPSDDACRQLLGYAKQAHVVTGHEGEYYCGDYSLWPVDRHYYVIKLCYATAHPADWVGSETVGWYGVDKTTGDVVEWNVAEDSPGKKLATGKSIQRFEGTLKKRWE